MASVGNEHHHSNSAIRQLSIGTAIAHHGELVQGVFEDDRGRLHRGLVTLPLTGLRSTARFQLQRHVPLTVVPNEKSKALRAAGLTLALLGHDRPGATLHVESDIPVGHGYGSSTADVIAAIRAAAAAVGTVLPPATISRLAVAAEVASDATAFEAEAVLFAHREGEVLEHFGSSLPPFHLIGFRPEDAEVVDTLNFVSARYNAEEIQLFRVLRGLVASAVARQDPGLLGRAATISATLNQRHLAKPHFDFVMGYMDRIGALGLQVAHSGTLFGLLMDPVLPSNAPVFGTAKAELLAAGFSHVEVFQISGAGGFHGIRY
ncbi:kinase [Mesorhizobium microcysteis]|uniref:Kinase n=1 Tax=Neoaquamicrobium microcysteis TaxID=2682781 RepID=A0A5D4H904_9HYPH|nr:kinase [Mesorhizobium microcysteis]TYR36742.1 kinase [Mesorhizobium microcysteis]